MFAILAQTISYAVNIVVLLIIVRAVLSFFPNIDRGHPLVRALDQVVDPILRPFQRILPQAAGLDFSPLVAILVLNVVESILVRVLLNMGGGGL